MSLPNAFAEWKSAIARHPVTLPLEAKAIEAIACMSDRWEDRENQDPLKRQSTPDATGSSYVVIVDNRQVVGLFTERDVVRLVAQRVPLEQLTLRDVLQASPITVRESALTDFRVAIALFQQHQLTHLLVVDDGDRLVGLISRESLQDVVQSLVCQQGTICEPEFLLESQHDVLERIAKAEPLADILKALLQTTECHLPDTLCSILLCQDGRLHCAAAPSLSPDYCNAVDGVPIADGVGFCGTAAFRGEVTIVADIATDPLWQDYRDLALAHHLQASWSAPIFGSEGTVLGVFGIYYRERRSPQTQDIKGLRQLANIAGIAIEQFRTTQALTQLNRELERRVLERTAALQDAQTQFRRMTENVPGMIYRYVLHPDGTDEITYVGSQVREIFELEPETALQDVRRVWARIHPEDLLWLGDAVRVSAETLQPFTSSYRLFLPEKGLRWVQNMSHVERLNNGDVVWDGIVVDISDRKIVEQELSLKQNHLQALLDNIPHLAWIKDEQSRFIAVNQPFAEVCGVSAEALVGKNDYDIWPVELARAYRDDDFQVLRSERRKVVEERVSFANETLGWLETTKTPFRNANGKVAGTVGIATDITDRKEAEQQLQELSERLELAIQSAQMGIWEYDIISDRLAWDDRMFAIYGVRPEDFSGTHRNWEQQVHPDDLERALPHLAVDRHRPTKEFRILRPDGEVRHIFSSAFIKRNEQDQPIASVGINLDISDRKQAELALEQEVLRRTTIFNTSSDGIHIIDIKGHLIEANASFLRMLGYTEEEAKHLSVADWDAQWTREELQEKILSYPWDTSEIWTLDTLHQHKDGSIFPVEISICGMEWNRQLSLICISRDISERKQAESQLQRTNEELLRATRLKDEFLANMSHELRTPLNAILGMSESLQEGLLGAVNAKQLQALKIVERSGAHLLELINEILDLAKIEAGRVELGPASVAVTELCQLSLTFIKQQALGKRIQLHLELPPNLPDIWVDKRRIRQVLINLLSNAVKFTPAEGRIALEVVSLPSDTTRKQRYLRFSVTDNGIGITPENLKKLFQPFVQVDSALNRQYEGTGLGLALVKRIVELHGGEVAVTSKVGVGSCFSIELPYITAESYLPPTDPAWVLNPSLPDREQPSTAPLILLAEDNETNINTLSSYLEAKGYRLQVAKDGRAAIALARAISPNIILMDIQMPGMDGIEAIQHLRKLPEFSQTPIIALTALAMEEDRERCLAAGATMYLSKPVRLKQLVRSIEKLLQ
ncbi:MAG: PAS domain S-box protein [Cyanobacteria bacterium P01_E01_bin.42]